MPIAFETFDFKYETRLLLPNRIIEAKNGVAHIISKAEVAHFEGFLAKISQSNLNDLQKAALINMALDHFGWAKKRPDSDGQINFLRAKFHDWFNTYAPAAIHICRRKGGYLTMGIAIDDIVFENARYTFRRGDMDVFIIDRQGNTVQPLTFELQQLDHVNFLINTTEKIMMRHIPLMSHTLHSWFCGAVTHREDDIYHKFFDCRADLMLLLLSSNSAQADKDLFPRSW